MTHHNHNTNVAGTEPLVSAVKELENRIKILEANAAGQVDIEKDLEKLETDFARLSIIAKDAKNFGDFAKKFFHLVYGE